MGRMTEADRLRKRVAELEASIESRVAERVEVIVEAIRLTGGDGSEYVGKTPMQIRAAAVAALRGHASIDGRTDDYVTGMWDHAREVGVSDRVRQTLMSRHRVNIN